MDPNHYHFNTQNSSTYPFSYQNPNNYQDPSQFSNQRPQNPQNPQYPQYPPNFGFAPNFNQSSFVPNFHPYGSMMRYPSPTPMYNGYMPMVNENCPSVGAPEFPGFSTQMTIGGMTAGNEGTPNEEDTTPKSKKSQPATWNKAQNLVLISGWIKYGTNSIVGRNQKSEAYWGNIADYCNEHCLFDPPRDGVACRNRFNYMNKILGKWIGAYDKAKREQGSGWSENDVLAKAQEHFAGGKNVQFTLMEEWEALRDQPRYCSQVESGSSGSKRSRESDACGSNSIGSIPRPMGREAAKRKGKKKSKEAESEVVDKEWAEYKQMKEKEIERLDKIALMQQEANQLMKEKTQLMKEKAHTKKMSMYVKLSSEENLDDRKQQLLENLSRELFGN